MKSLFVFCLLYYLLDSVAGHGMLMEPASRNSMWRKGYPNPVNYNDNELYCGGFVVHYQKNGGKCGVCGDNHKDAIPRLHEDGGLFGNGIIARRYARGQSLNIHAKLTTNHGGWMEVKLCNTDEEELTQECLERSPLYIVGSPERVEEGYKFRIPKGARRRNIEFKWKVQLPDDVICNRCVLQWTYMAGNTWGKCKNGTGNVGCGEQETFINCADIAVYSDVKYLSSESSDNPWALFTRASQYQGNTVADSDTGLQPLVITASTCVAKGLYKTIPGMDRYCVTQCMRYPSLCHASVCDCYEECDPIGEFAMKKDAEVFCNQYCLGNPSHCPENECKCF